MQVMMFGESPTFDEILKGLKDLEEAIRKNACCRLAFFTISSAIMIAVILIGNILFEYADRF